jgi:2-polyprenyl-3-methyl-5-hydroxy-6-metoxy-1,4-benzoquinol methylase
MKYVDIKRCPICASAKNKKISKKKQESGYFDKKVIVTLNICKKCSFVFQNPRIKQKYLDKYYKKSRNSSGRTFFEKTKKNYKYNLNFIRKKFLQKFLKKTKLYDLLEVGSSTHDFLNILDKKKFNLHAVEPSKQKKNKNITTLNQTFEKINFKKKFDIVACFHTLEHIFDINNFLKKINQITTDEGMIYVEVPNALKMGFITIEEFYPFEHMSHFNEYNLKILLSKYNFSQFTVDKKDKTNLRILAIKDTKKKVLSLDKKIINKNTLIFLRNFKDYEKKNNKYRKFIINKVNKIIKNNKIEKKITAVYGAGVHTHYLFNLLENPEFVNYIFDSDLNKKGCFFLDHKIKHSSQILDFRIDTIIISSVNFENEIFKYLRRINFKNKIQLIKLYNHQK